MGYHVAYIPKVGFPGSQKLPVLLSAWADLMMMSWVTKQGEGCCCMFGNSSRPCWLIRVEITTKRLWRGVKKGPRPVQEMPEMQNIRRRAHGGEKAAFAVTRRAALFWYLCICICILYLYLQKYDKHTGREGSIRCYQGRRQMNLYLYLYLQKFDKRRRCSLLLGGPPDELALFVYLCIFIGVCKIQNRGGVLCYQARCQMICTCICKGFVFAKYWQERAVFAVTRRCQMNLNCLGSPHLKSFTAKQWTAAGDCWYIKQYSFLEILQLKSTNSGLVKPTIFQRAYYSRGIFPHILGFFYVSLVENLNFGLLRFDLYCFTVCQILVLSQNLRNKK